jgi:ATP-dependent DNA helicase RecG
MTSPGYVAAMEDPDLRARGIRLTVLPEDQWFERKSARVRAQDLASDIVALAHAEGGVICIGVADGRVEGTDGRPDARNAQMQAAIDFTRPPVRITSVLLDVVRDDGLGDHVLVITVPPSDGVHTTHRDEAYLRVGDESRKLTHAQYQELVYDRGQAHFDGSVVQGIRFEDLDPVLLQQYHKRLGARDLKHTMEGFGLLTPSGAVTAAAYLLFSERPQNLFPEAYIRILRYRGTDRGTGVRQQLSDDRRCRGPLPRMIDEAVEEVRLLQPGRRALAGSRFARQPIIPEEAWIEGIVNAVVHRSYSIGGDHTRVEVFDDRIDVYSPGRFPGLSRVRDPLKAPRFARNPRIAQVCSVLEYGQELGEGIRRMFEEMRLAGLADPVYRETPASVHLRLEAAVVNQAALAQLPFEAREVMPALRGAGGLSTGDLADVTLLSRPTAIRLLKQMEHANLIEWVGNSPKDPRAYWRIKSE